MRRDEKRLKLRRPIIIRRGPDEARPGTRNGGPLRERSCNRGSRRGTSHDAGTTDEHRNHDDCDDIANDDHGAGDHDEHGDRSSDGHGAGASRRRDHDASRATIDQRLLATSDYPSRGERARYADRRGTSCPIASAYASAPNLGAARDHTAARSRRIRLPRRRCIGLRGFVRCVPRRRSREVAPRSRHLRRGGCPRRSGRERNDQPRRMAQARRLAALGARRSSQPVLLRASLGLCPKGVPLEARAGGRRPRLRREHRRCLWRCAAPALRGSSAPATPPEVRRSRQSDDVSQQLATRASRPRTVPGAPATSTKSGAPQRSPTGVPPTSRRSTFDRRAGANDRTVGGGPLGAPRCSLRNPSRVVPCRAGAEPDLGEHEPCGSVARRTARHRRLRRDAGSRHHAGTTPLAPQRRAPATGRERLRRSA